MPFHPGRRIADNASSDQPGDCKGIVSAQLFVTVDDVTTSAEKAQALGAKLIIPPTTLPEGDEMAVLLDPQGLSFAIWRASKS